MDFPPVSFSHLCRDLLAVHREVGCLMFDAMMPGLTVEEVARLKRLEAKARAERKQLCNLIRDECRLRVDAWEAGGRYSSLGSLARGAGWHGDTGRDRRASRSQ